MLLLKIIAKLLLIPVAVMLTLIQWILIFLNSFSGVVMGILSFIFILTGIAGLAFGVASGPEILKELALAFVLFVIPHIGDWLVERIVLFRFRLRYFIWS